MAWTFKRYVNSSVDIGTGNNLISIKTDVDECMRFFNGLDVNKAAISRNIMKAVGQGARTVARRNLSKTLHRRTGNLYSHVRYALTTKEVSIYSNAEAGRTGKYNRPARYGFMLGSGFTIKPKKGDVMRFQRNGKWVSYKEYTVRPKDFLEPPIQRWVGSADYKARVDKAFQQQVNYWERKITGGNLK